MGLLPPFRALRWAPCTRGKSYWVCYAFSELELTPPNQKLSPFFPPLEPLQSTNLRAALYRLLAQLKKDGVLPSNASILRTTLDECKWEKIGDLLLCFSTLVLKKACIPRERGNRSSKARQCRDRMEKNAVTRKLVLADAIRAEAEKENLLALTLAHESSLASLLKKRRELKDGYSSFSRILDEKSESISRRDQELGNIATLLEQSSAIKGDHTALERQLNENWLGNSRWLDVIVHGEGRTTDDVLFGMREDQVLRTIGSGEEPGSKAQDIGLVEELERRAVRQEKRLRQWRRFQDRLVSSENGGKRADEILQPDEEGSFPKTRFGAHQDIIIGKTRSLEPKTKGQQSEPARAFRYMSQDMEAQLEQISKSRKHGGAGWSVPRPPIVWLAPASIKDQEEFIKGVSLPSKSGQHMPSKLPRGLKTSSVSSRPFSTAAFQASRGKPLKTFASLSINTHPSSDSTRSADSVSVSASTEMTDYFPPLSSATLASLSNTAPSSPLTSIKHRPTLASQSTETTLVALGRDDPSTLTSTSEEFSSSPSDVPSPIEYSGPSNDADQIIEELGRLSIAQQGGERLLPTERTLLFKSAEEEEEEEEEDDIELPEETPRPRHGRQASIADQILDSVVQDTPSPSKRALMYKQHSTKSLGLVERTRLSMAHTNPAIQLESDSEDDLPTIPALSPPPEASTKLDRRASLLDRTRESMARVSSLSTTKSTRSRKSVRQSRPSLYPINQFGTPSKKSVIDWENAGLEGEDQGARTPQEKLFSDDADMASVFKSRPKIALSPVLGPTDGVAGSDEGYDS